MQSCSVPWKLRQRPLQYVLSCNRCAFALNEFVYPIKIGLNCLYTEVYFAEIRLLLLTLPANNIELQLQRLRKQYQDQMQMEMTSEKRKSAAIIASAKQESK